MVYINSEMWFYTLRTMSILLCDVWLENSGHLYYWDFNI